MSRPRLIDPAEASSTLTLERELLNNKDPRLVMERLKVARQELDEALGDL